MRMLLQQILVQNAALQSQPRNRLLLLVEEFATLLQHILGRIPSRASVQDYQDTRLSVFGDDIGNRHSNLPCNKYFASTRRFMIKKNTVACKQGKQETKQRRLTLNIFDVACLLKETISFSQKLTFLQILYNIFSGKLTHPSPHHFILQ
jgi:hypothetical protein